MSQYRIDKHRCPVVVTMLSGQRLSGEMFVQPYLRHRSGPEEPEDVLNAAEPYFPLSTSDGDTILVAKDLVAEVEAPRPVEMDPVRFAGIRSVGAELRLVTGAVRSGSVHLEVPSDRPRLLDFLNLAQQRFVALYDAETVRLLHRRAIEHVRQLD